LGNLVRERRKGKKSVGRKRRIKKQKEMCKGKEQRLFSSKFISC
jgi:hypothetical protein